MLEYSLLLSWNNIDDIIHLYSPTAHKGFAQNENHEREKYETAQQIGENGHDCDVIYADCENSILNKFSYLNVEK